MNNAALNRLLEHVERTARGECVQFKYEGHLERAYVSTLSTLVELAEQLDENQLFLSWRNSLNTAFTTAETRRA